ncbi:MAG TPA: permease prefix domain 1-containing protein [Chloroflexota bacterium]|nr:permease prefix domain 1-containing protein [Chloroflexota bacterium]
MAQDVFEALSGRLRMRPKTRDQVLRELRTHLDDARMELEAAGQPTAEAERESLRRFGDPVEIGRMLSIVHRRPTRRTRLVLVATFAVATLSAGFGAVGTLAAHPAAHHHAAYHHAAHHHHLSKQRPR